MTKDSLVKQILQEKLVAIIRLHDQDELAMVIQGAIAGGIKVLEITSNTPGYLEEISKARAKYPQTLIGAGTITNSSIAEKAIAAGAQFLVSPNTHVEVIKIAHQHHIPVLMGAMTPTEICMAGDAGADIVKFFPAGELGLSYFKAIRGPLNKVRMMAVGGITSENMGSWMEAGAIGVGIGSVLTKKVGGVRSVYTVEKNARILVDQIAEY